MSKIDELCKILIGSKTYTYENGVLEFTNYHTGEKVALDLEKLIEEYPEITEDIIV